MFETQIKSKAYIQKKNNGALIIIISICVIITAIIGIISIISDGLKVGNASQIVIALAIGITALNKSRTKYEYVFDIASISIGEQLEIYYYESQLKVLFQISDIFLLQYSDKLNCLRLFGNYKRTQNNKTEDIVNNEYLLYLGAGEEVEIINELETTTKLKVQYMDR